MSARKGITITIPTDLYKRVVAIAEKDGRTFSNQVEQWIKEKLGKTK